MNDLEFTLVDPDSSLGVSGQVHSGFQDTWKRTRDSFSTTVQDTLTKHEGASIITTGHSLGMSLNVKHVTIAVKLELKFFVYNRSSNFPIRCTLFPE